jgi:hypothetical protein
VDHHHGVLFPRLASLPVSNTTPEVDNLLAMLKNAAGAAQLASPGKILSKRIAHGPES